MKDTIAGLVLNSGLQNAIHGKMWNKFHTLPTPVSSGADKQTLGIFRGFLH